MCAIDFSSLIPLFPLPNCVLFPGAVLPLHLFEERYKEMMAWTMDDQGLIAMALLSPGWEKHYHGHAEIHPTVCVGKVVAHERLDDGKYNLLLQGVTRARVRQEAKPSMERAFRLAKLEKIEDRVPKDAGVRVEQLRGLLGRLFIESALANLSTAASFREMLESGLPLGTIADVLAFALIQEVPAKQKLLEEPNTLRRTEMLLEKLAALTNWLDQRAVGLTGLGKKTWPPAAGAN